MDFREGLETEEEFRSEIREFAAQKLPKEWSLADQWEEYSLESWPVTKMICQELGKRGWLGLSWPKKYGGREASVFEQLVFREETSYLGIPGTDMGVGGMSWVGPSLLRFGTEEQKQRFLPPLVRGEEFWCTGYSEPEAGSDLASLTTRAVLTGNEYVVNGQKVFTSAAHIADWCWLAVRTNQNVPPHKGISLIMVDLKTPGITIRPLITMAGRGTFNEVYFDDVKVPKENLVGGQDKGWVYIMTALTMERAWPCVLYASWSRRVLDEIIKFWHSTDMAMKPQIRSALAAAATDVEVLRMLAYRVVSMVSQEAVPGYEASVAMVYGTQVMNKVIDVGMKTLGLYGQLRGSYEHSSGVLGWLNTLYLVAPGATLATGSAEIQRSIIATRGLGLPSV